MKITIDVKENGAILNIPVGINNDYKLCKLYKFDPYEHVNIDDYINMLYELTDAIFLFGKYSQERIKISRVHGEKYECDDKNCEICRGE